MLSGLSNIHLMTMVRSFLAISLSFSSIVAVASPEKNSACFALQEAFLAEGMTADVFARMIRSFRKSEIQPTSLKEISVNGSKYEVIGILGESSAIAYLAKSENRFSG